MRFLVKTSLTDSQRPLSTITGSPEMKPEAGSRFHFTSRTWSLVLPLPCPRDQGADRSGSSQCRHSTDESSLLYLQSLSLSSHPDSDHTSPDPLQTGNQVLYLECYGL